ncbi:fibronectin type III domain-containing protein [Parabacteroides sp. FAFU027]|uniref:fibronectin type III domain-containing protein n=1 Tax=Parabacteroides sp. FAFU027 TaxID=2922715 RepID=UPI001FAFB920|nr:fibronectin type III domain-containing protein [Parabacteroides sp. FAFU027]
MSTCRILNSYERYSDSELSVSLGRIISNIKGNPSFPDPKPTVAEDENLKVEYDGSLSAAQSGDRVKIALKNEKRVEVIDLKHRWARYVELEANGSRTIMLSSGFDVSKERTSTVELDQPQNVKVFDGKNPGELVASCDGLAGAKSYIFQYTTDPLSDSSVWTNEPTTKSEFTFKGLKSGQKYWFRVVAVGSNDQRTVSIVVSRIVQ